MDGDLKWVITGAITVGLALLSGFVGGFWRLLALIRATDTAAKERDDKLHSRVNRVREDTVHKSDLQDMATRIDHALDETRREQRAAANALSGRLDAIMEAIANRNSHNHGGKDT